MHTMQDSVYLYLTLQCIFMNTLLLIPGPCVVAEEKKVQRLVAEEKKVQQLVAEEKKTQCEFSARGPPQIINGPSLSLKQSL